MRFLLASIYFLAFTSLTLGQDYTQQWEGHFSFLKVNGIDLSEEGIAVAAENALYQHNTSSNSTQTTTTINGLTGNVISTYLYNSDYQTSVVGYENGLLEIVNQDNEVTTVVDIVEEANIPQNLKRINHLYAYDHLVYIATDYGISVYDLDRLEFQVTYFIGSGGAQSPIAVNQVTILDDYIYAATAEDGLKRALHADPNIIDFSLWNTISPGSQNNWKSVVTHNNAIYALNSSDNLYHYDQSSFTNITSFSPSVNDHRTVENFMVFTANTQIWVYDNLMNLVHSIPYSSEFGSNFTVATLNSTTAYVGTQENGVQVYDLSSSTITQTLQPNGPLSNSVFAIRAGNNEAWLVYGDHTEFFNPYPLDSRGISHLQNQTWRNIPFDELLDARSLVDIAVNPYNANQAYISSYYSGLLEITNNEASTIYNTSNSALASLSETLGGSAVDIRVGRSNFDNNGKLWLTNNLTTKPLKALDVTDNSWQVFDLEPVVSSSNPDNDEIGFSELVIDRNNTKWIGGYSKGVIGFNEQLGPRSARNLSIDNGNLPSNSVRALAVDKDNNLWIGTQQGLRVLYNTGNFFSTGNPQAQQIIILDDGIPKELMFGQYITDIEVDGANNKWIATFDAGVFYVSSDGQRTICHFTTNNSPLPSNSIVDLSIDEVSGKVYFATTNGVVALKGLIKEPAEDLNEVAVYPNPVRPEMVRNLLGYPAEAKGDKGIKIDGLTEKVNIKITDVSGNLVADANTNTQNGNLFISEGNIAVWNGKNFNNSIVATGVYFIMITDLDSKETTIKKVMIVR